jgi:hypothetical protein
VYFGDDEILVHRDVYVKVVGTGGTLRENATSPVRLVVDLAQRVGVYKRVGAVA